MRAYEFINESLTGGGSSQNLPAPTQAAKPLAPIDPAGLKSPVGSSDPKLPTPMTANDIKRRKQKR